MERPSTSWRRLEPGPAEMAPRVERPEAEAHVGEERQIKDRRARRRPPDRLLDDNAVLHRFDRNVAERVIGEMQRHIGEENEAGREPDLAKAGHCGSIGAMAEKGSTEAGTSASLRRVQPLAHLRRQVVKRERLADHVNARLDSPVADDCVAAIAGHEQHPKAAAKPDRFVGEFASIHVSGHHDIGQQQIELLCVFKDRQSGFARSRLRRRCSRARARFPPYRRGPRRHLRRRERFRDPPARTNGFRSPSFESARRALIGAADRS